MNRRDFLRRSALVAAGAVAADQLELLDRLGWRRRFFALGGLDFTPWPDGSVGLFAGGRGGEIGVVLHDGTHATLTHVPAGQFFTALRIKGIVPSRTTATMVRPLGFVSYAPHVTALI